MMWFSGTRNRRPRRPCAACGLLAPLDAIRLRGGRLYCPQGACRRAAEALIREARGRLEAAPAPQEAWALVEMPGVAFPLEDDRGTAAVGESAVLGSIDLEIAAGAILIEGPPSLSWPPWLPDRLAGPREGAAAYDPPCVISIDTPHSGMVSPTVRCGHTRPAHS